MRRQDFEHRPTLIRADEPVGRALPLDQAADQHALCGPYRDDLPPIGVGPDAELAQLRRFDLGAGIFLGASD